MSRLHTINLTRFVCLKIIFFFKIRQWFTYSLKRDDAYQILSPLGKGLWCLNICAFLEQAKQLTCEILIDGFTVLPSLFLESWKRALQINRPVITRDSIINSNKNTARVRIRLEYHGTILLLRRGLSWRKLFAPAALRNSGRHASLLENLTL